jgi:hypothetical protein
MRESITHLPRGTATPPPTPGLQRHRRHAVPALLLLLGSVAIAAADRFEPTAALGAAGQHATGIYLLGRAWLPGEPIEVYALLHNGEVLQVHARLHGSWLAKRHGSRGGKPLAPSRFDELMAIAGGADRDVRAQGARVHADFARVGGLLRLKPGDTAAEGRAVKGPGSGATRLTLIEAAHASDCGEIGCTELYRLTTRDGRGFVIRTGVDRATWSFSGYGIVSVWGVPSR